MDARLLVGLLLVLGSVSLGARVLRSADQYATVYAAAHDLAPGTALRRDDLTVARVRFGAGDAATYVSAGQAPPEGYVLGRPVGQGELIARSAVRPVGGVDSRLVAVAVPAGHLPDGLARGSLVDVLVTAKAADGAPGATTTVATRLPVDAVPDPSSNRLAAAEDTVVTLRVPAVQVVSLVGQVQAGTVALVLVPPGAAPPTVGSPAPAPAVPSAAAPPVSPSASPQAAAPAAAPAGGGP